MALRSFQSWNNGSDTNNNPVSIFGLSCMEAGRTTHTQAETDGFTMNLRMQQTKGGIWQDDFEISSTDAESNRYDNLERMERERAAEQERIERERIERESAAEQALKTQQKLALVHAQAAEESASQARAASEAGKRDEQALRGFRCKRCHFFDEKTRVRVERAEEAAREAKKAALDASRTQSLQEAQAAAEEAARHAAAAHAKAQYVVAEAQKTAQDLQKVAQARAAAAAEWQRKEWERKNANMTVIVRSAFCEEIFFDRPVTVTLLTTIRYVKEEISRRTEFPVDKISFYDGQPPFSNRPSLPDYSTMEQCNIWDGKYIRMQIAR